MRTNQVLKMKKKKAKSILLTAAALLIVAFLGAWITFRILVGSQDIGQLDVPLPAATILYDQSGTEATRISFNKIEEIGYEEIP
ncbi:MAG TPA: hypothetical protein VL921_17255, partial [Candidatus Udaeobacter sp.]|nr:hypothetical protein [Candidatus Udaeobacter sp.]